MRWPRLGRTLVLAGIHLGVVLASGAAAFVMGASRFDHPELEVSWTEWALSGVAVSLSRPGEWVWEVLSAGPVRLVAEWPFIFLNSLAWALALDFGWKVVYWFRSHAKGASPEFPASSD